MNNYFDETQQADWIVLLPLSFFLFFDFVQLNIMSTIGPVILKILSISTSDLGVISSLFFYVNLVLLFPAGFLLDRYKVKWPAILSIFLAIIGILGFAFSPGVKTVIIWRMLSGIAGAFSYISCVNLLATNFPRKYLGLLLGLTGIVIMFSGVVVQYPLLKLLSFVGLTNTLYLDAIIGVITIMLLIIFVQNKSNLVIYHGKRLLVFLNPVNWLIAVYACLTNFPLFILGALWGNLYLMNAHHFSMASSSIITSMIFIGNMMGAPVLGRISDRNSSRKHLMVFSALLMLAVTIIIMIMSKNQSTTLFAILFFALGFSTGSQTLAYASIVDVNSKSNISKAASMLSFLSVGGGAIAQPLFGFIIQTVHKENYQNGMYMMLFASFLAFLCAVLFQRTRGAYKELLMVSSV